MGVYLSKKTMGNFDFFLILVFEESEEHYAMNAEIRGKMDIYTVKPDHAVTSIKQSPVLKGHIFLVLS